jgi:hypothetical protein
MLHCIQRHPQLRVLRHKRQHTSACVSICLTYATLYSTPPAAQGPAAQASAYVSIRQHMSDECYTVFNATRSCVSIRPHTSAHVRTRPHTSAHVSIRQHTSGYLQFAQDKLLMRCSKAETLIRQHTSAYVRIPAVRARQAPHAV